MSTGQAQMWLLAMQVLHMQGDLESELPAPFAFKADITTFYCVGARFVWHHLVSAGCACNNGEGHAICVIVSEARQGSDSYMRLVFDTQPSSRRRDGKRAAG